MYWAVILLLLLLGGVLFYVWWRNIRSFDQFVDATKADVARLSPAKRRREMPPSAPDMNATAPPGAYAGRRRRRHY